MSSGQIGQKLRAVAYPENGNPGLQQPRAELGRGVVIDAARSAGEDNPLIVFGYNFIRTDAVIILDLREDSRLADSPRDELAILPAEVQHQYFFRHYFYLLKA